MVPGAGIEPARSCPRQILSLLRLPISPSGQDAVTAIAYDSRARHDTKSVVRTIRGRFRLLRTTAMRRTRLCRQDGSSMRLRIGSRRLACPIRSRRSDCRIREAVAAKRPTADTRYRRCARVPGQPAGKLGMHACTTARMDRTDPECARSTAQPRTGCRATLSLRSIRTKRWRKKTTRLPWSFFSNWRPRSELNRRTRICSPLHNHSATRPVTCHSILPAAASACNRCKPSPEKTKPRGRGFVSEDDSVTGGPLIWSGKRDSNSRPRPWQGRALPTELFPLKEAIF